MDEEAERAKNVLVSVPGMQMKHLFGIVWSDNRGEGGDTDF
jgi:hypothetical protein